MNELTTRVLCGFWLALRERNYLLVLAAVCVAGAILLPGGAIAQDPGYASAAVTIGFAPDGGNCLGQGVTIAFQNATTTASGGAAITIGFGSPADPSTQLGRPRNASFNADPVNTATGNYVFDHTDLSVPGRGLGLAFARFYNSLDSTNGSLGPGWTHSYNVTLTVVSGDQSLQVRWGDGHIDYYNWTGSSYIPRYPGVFDIVSRAGDGTFTIQQKSQTRWHFTSAGRLDTITDRNNNAVGLSYDGAGRLVTVQEPGGRSLSFIYDGAGRITGIADPLPRRVAFAYDAAGQLHSVADVDGGVETYTYDGNRQLLTATDPRGAVYLTNTYDAVKRVVTWQADAKGNSFQFAYDPATGQTTITDPLGHASVDAHDVLNRLIRQTDRLGRSVSYTYDAQNNRTAITDQNGNTTTYTYDAVGNVLGKVDARDQTTAITYDALNDPLTRTDEAGNITRFTYDSRGNLLTTTDPLSRVTTITYDAYGHGLTVTDANGGVTTTAYDAAGNLVSVTDARGASTLYAYDAVGRRLTATDPRGFVITSAYSGSGRVLTATDPLGHVVTNVYDANGSRTQTTDVRGGITAFTLNANNLLTTVTDPLGGVTKHTYDGLDRRLTTTDARGEVTTFGYDAEGRLTQTTDPAGAITQIAYDGVGNKIAVTDANGHMTGFTFDALNRLVTTTDPLGHATRHTYDALGHVTKTTDAAGRETAFAYDAMGRLTQVTDPEGGTARYTYDAIGNRLTVTDPNGPTTTLTYDAANRLLTSKDPLGHVSQFTYDASGNRRTVTDAMGVTLTYAYDASNHLTSIHPPSGTAVTLTYDAAGNRTAMVDAVGTTTYVYDLLNRLTQYTDAYGQAIGYDYDAVGNRTALVYPDGKRVAYGFDQANRLSTVTDWAGRTTRYTYDAAGQLTGTANANGSTAAYLYDAAGRLTRLANQRGDGSVLASYDYTLDAVGNRTAVAEVTPLVASPAPATAMYSYNAANEILTGGTGTFISDVNGRLTTRTDAGVTTTYGWDVFDRLTQVSNGTMTAQYVYNGAGTRLARTVNGTTTRFVVDPQPALSQLLVETDGAGTPVARYVYGIGLIARIDAAGQALTYHLDPRGSTVAMTDAGEAVVNRYAYDEFGGVRDRQETVAQGLRYVGQYGVVQEPNGLLFMRARYFLPAEGRFLNVDPSPIVNTPQDLNRFVYSNNNPALWIDPLGLASWESLGSFVVAPTFALLGTGAMMAKDAADAVDFVGRAVHWQPLTAVSHGLGSAEHKAWTLEVLAVSKAMGITTSAKDANAVAIQVSQITQGAFTYLSNADIAGSALVGEPLLTLGNAWTVVDWVQEFIDGWLPEQLEVRRPASSTNKKPKRDTGR
jgi:RHS repeat-associated protein